MSPYMERITSTAEKYGVPVNYALATAWVESSGNPRATSPKGAKGLFQVMPGTAKDMGQTVFEGEEGINQNIEAGIKYLSMFLPKTQSYALTSATYNAGPKAMAQYGGKQIPPYPETEDYVERVLTNFHALENYG